MQCNAFTLLRSGMLIFLTMKLSSWRSFFRFSKKASKIINLVYVGQTIPWKTIRQNALKYIDKFKEACQRTVHVDDLIKVRKDGRHFCHVHDLLPLQWARKHGLQYAQHTNVCVLRREQLWETERETCSQLSLSPLLHTIIDPTKKQVPRISVLSQWQLWYYNDLHSFPSITKTRKIKFLSTIIYPPVF